MSCCSLLLHFLLPLVLAGPALRSGVTVPETTGHDSIFTGHALFNKQGERVDADEVLAGKEVAIFYAGEFCPVCRNFTPKLRDFFEKRNEEGRPLEVIFLSADESEEAALRHFKRSHGDWLRLGFSDALATELKRKYRIASGVPHELAHLNAEERAERRSGVPAVLLIKPDGTEVQFFNTERLGRAALDPWDSMESYAWPSRDDL
eukprot:CAMPEP_0197664604 /NCGR_PEP_ID=MMETSP1338-20131121/58740_1 /TAXON_ID=43686 ORGANISM="Pelagodinium beii, Strain RCC1491" /NCGR_SAMPLE_ID=MMETSP1338 /ASSEMBLY_ACC=CAM_ASM_000754 /LENGTH=204 /DNA_ID=CAMNT_0043243285 /DNA_START=27 /DNA_END=641 /DNA_ORIENTATION=-